MLWFVCGIVAHLGRLAEGLHGASLVPTDVPATATIGLGGLSCCCHRRSASSPSGEMSGPSRSSAHPSDLPSSPSLTAPGVYRDGSNSKVDDNLLYAPSSTSHSPESPVRSLAPSRRCVFVTLCAHTPCCVSCVCLFVCFYFDPEQPASIAFISVQFSVPSF